MNPQAPNMIIKPAQNGYLNPNWDSSTEKGAVFFFKHLIILTVMRGCGSLVFYFPHTPKKKQMAVKSLFLADGATPNSIAIFGK